MEIEEQRKLLKAFLPPEVHENISKLDSREIVRCMEFRNFWNQIDTLALEDTIVAYLRFANMDIHNAIAALLNNVSMNTPIKGVKKLLLEFCLNKSINYNNAQYFLSNFLVIINASTSQSPETIMDITNLIEECFNKIPPEEINEHMVNTVYHFMAIISKSNISSLEDKKKISDLLNTIFNSPKFIEKYNRYNCKDKDNILNCIDSLKVKGFEINSPGQNRELKEQQPPQPPQPSDPNKDAKKDKEKTESFEEKPSPNQKLNNQNGKDDNSKDTSKSQPQPPQPQLSMVSHSLRSFQDEYQDEQQQNDQFSTAHQINIDDDDDDKEEDVFELQSKQQMQNGRQQMQSQLQQDEQPSQPPKPTDPNKDAKKDKEKTESFEEKPSPSKEQNNQNGKDDNSKDTSKLQQQPQSSQPSQPPYLSKSKNQSPELNKETIESLKTFLPPEVHENILEFSKFKPDQQEELLNFYKHTTQIGVYTLQLQNMIVSYLKYILYEPKNDWRRVDIIGILLHNTPVDIRICDIKELLDSNLDYSGVQYCLTVLLIIIENASTSQSPETIMDITNLIEECFNKIPPEEINGCMVSAMYHFMDIISKSNISSLEDKIMISNLLNKIFSLPKFIEECDRDYFKDNILNCIDSLKVKGFEINLLELNKETIESLKTFLPPEVCENISKLTLQQIIASDINFMSSKKNEEQEKFVNEIYNINIPPIRICLIENYLESYLKESRYEELCGLLYIFIRIRKIQGFSFVEEEKEIDAINKVYQYLLKIPSEKGHYTSYISRICSIVYNIVIIRNIMVLHNSFKYDIINIISKILEIPCVINALNDALNNERDRKIIEYISIRIDSFIRQGFDIKLPLTQQQIQLMTMPPHHQQMQSGQLLAMPQLVRSQPPMTMPPQPQSMIMSQPPQSRTSVIQSSQMQLPQMQSQPQMTMPPQPNMLSNPQPQSFIMQQLPHPQQMQSGQLLTTQQPVQSQPQMTMPPQQLISPQPQSMMIPQQFPQLQPSAIQSSQPQLPSSVVQQPQMYGQSQPQMTMPPQQLISPQPQSMIMSQPPQSRTSVIQSSQMQLPQMQSQPQMTMPSQPNMLSNPQPQSFIMQQLPHPQQMQSGQLLTTQQPVQFQSQTMPPQQLISPQPQSMMIPQQFPQLQPSAIQSSQPQLPSSVVQQPQMYGQSQPQMTMPPQQLISPQPQSMIMSQPPQSRTSVIQSSQMQLSQMPPQPQMTMPPQLPQMQQPKPSEQRLMIILPPEVQKNIPILTSDQQEEFLKICNQYKISSKLSFDEFIELDIILENRGLKYLEIIGKLLTNSIINNNLEKYLTNGEYDKMCHLLYIFTATQRYCDIHYSSKQETWCCVCNYLSKIPSGGSLSRNICCILDCLFYLMSPRILLGKIDTYINADVINNILKIPCVDNLSDREHNFVLERIGLLRSFGAEIGYYDASSRRFVNQKQRTL